jgi:hypothetical protein
MFHWGRRGEGAEGLVRVASSVLPCVQDCVVTWTVGLRTCERGYLCETCAKTLAGTSLNRHNQNPSSMDLGNGWVGTGGFLNPPIKIYANKL